MAALDIFFIALLGLLILRGFLKGFTGELFSIASTALGLIAAVFLFRSVAVFIRQYFLQVNLLPEILAFLAVFLVVFIACKLLEHVVKDIINRLNLNSLDRVLGIFLGLAKGIAVIIIIVFIFIRQPFVDASGFLGNSFFVRLLLPVIGSFHV